ncbi:MAG: S8 family serine peptidase [Lachnospiraceae bacterium]|nr:S8 family serine peptidase [Lachnospiraceae bacterium]
MIRKRLSAVFTAIALTAAMWANPVFLTSNVYAAASDRIYREYDKSSVLIKLADNASLDALNECLKKADSIKPVTIRENDATLGYVTLSLADNVTVEQAIAQLSVIPGIIHVQPDYIYHIPDVESSYGRTLSDDKASSQAKTNDPLLNDGSYGDQWHLSRIHAYDAWDLQKTGKKVTVAVLDTLVDINHPDIKDNIVARVDMLGKGWGYETADPYSHGTHISGIIAAGADNGIGTAGVSYNAGIFAVRLFDNDGSSKMSTILKAVKCVIDNKDKYNIKVVNMSFGIDASEYPTVAGYDAGIDDLSIIDCVNSLYDAGILSVMAAGNNADIHNGPYNMFPIDWSGNSLGVVALGGEDGNKNISIPSSDTDPLAKVYFSNYNKPGQRTKDISAPGYKLLSTTNKGGYTAYSGTSMATHVVSGVAALVYSVNPSFTAAQVKDIIHSSATDIGAAGWDEYTGFGCVDAKKAVEYAQSGMYFSGVSELTVGSTATLRPAKAGKYKWSSSDGSVATVSDTGVVTGKKSGVTVISATDTEGNTITREMSVHSVSLSGPATLEIGETSEAVLTVSSPEQYFWYFSSSDNDVVSVNYKLIKDDEYSPNTVVLTGLKKGKATISARCGSIVRSFDITVTNDGMVKAKIGGVKDKTYAGSAITQTPTVKLKGFTLKKGRDYALSYENNTDVGTAVMTITGKGKYHGTKSVTFKIKPKTVSGIKVTGLSSGTYTGSKITQTPKIKVGKKVLKNGVDYTLSYKNNTNAGKASMIVKLKGNYKGKKTVAFKIKKAANPLRVAGKEFALSKTDLDSADLTISANDLYAFQNKGAGTRQYSKKSGDKAFTVNSRTGKIKVKKGTPSGTYKIKVKVTSKGNKNYNKTTKTVTVTITIE